MQIVMKPLHEVAPYDGNPRINDKAVEPVARSIEAFGFNVPIVVDAGGVIVCGHTRYLAAQQLGLSEVPCVVASDLTPEKAKAYRIYDNLVADYSSWDKKALARELREIDNEDIKSYFEESFKFFDLLPDGGADNKQFAYNLVFTTTGNYDRFLSFVAKLRDKYPQCATTAERIGLQVEEWTNE
jgi:hypothetical protein